MVGMAEKMGAELLSGKKVTALDQGNGVVVTCGRETYRSKVVIGADGVNSPVRRLSGLEPFRERPDRIVSLVTEVPMPQADIDAVLGNDGGSYFDINFSTFFPGYAWIFPKRGRLNVGIGAVASHGGNIRKDLGTFMERMGLGVVEGRDVRGALIPCRPLRRMSKGRVLLVGDAAGLVDPFTGGGIDLGIGSGELAAEACRVALEEADLGLLERYDRAAAPIARSLRTKARLVNLATRLMEHGLDSPGADRAVLGLVNTVI
jgi:flavin-dependent dehydrogenase